MSKWKFFLLSFLVVSCLFIQFSQGKKKKTNKETDSKKLPQYVMYVWAGDVTRTRPDWLAVIDFDPKSENYSQLIASEELGPPFPMNNEPHHVGITPDGKYFIAGGLLSLLQNSSKCGGCRPPQHFLFDISDVFHPKFITGISSDLGCTDEYHLFTNDTFLASMLCNASGGDGGGLVEVNIKTRTASLFYNSKNNDNKPWPQMPGLNLHGFTIRYDNQEIISTDYVLPTSLFYPSQAIIYRQTLHVWDVPKKIVKAQINVPPVKGKPADGIMDVAYIPGDPNNRAIFCTTGNKFVYLIDGSEYKLYRIYNLSPILTGSGTAGTIKMHPSGKAFYMTLKWKAVLHFNITDPYKPILEQVIPLGYGSHYCHITDDGSRLMVSNHFLEMDSFGLFHVDGDHRILAFNINPKTYRLIPDDKFVLDFNNIPGKFPARPHGIKVRQMY